MAAALLYCTDPMNPRQVDPHFAAEAGSARALGCVIGRIDHDALLGGRAQEAVATVPTDLGPAWYRGWMVPSDRYAALAAALAARGCQLLTTPRRYRSAHELPGWYDVFAAVTPPSVWMASAAGAVPSPAELTTLVAPLGGGPGIVKDYVKSRKHEWLEACFVPELTDAVNLHRLVTRFVGLQEDFLAGGIVVRSFEDFGGQGRDSAGSSEARVWWLDGEPVLVGPHPDTPEQCPDPELDQVHDAVRKLGCRFVTTDVALRADGVWRVIEVGDGQVSDLPRTIDPVALVTALIAAVAGPPAGRR